MFSPQSPNRRPENGHKPVSKEAKRRLLVLLLLTFALLIIYYGVMALPVSPLVVKGIMLVYMAAFAGLLITYLIYNRGFVNKNITVEDLPDTWTPEKKQAFVEDNRRRAEKSRWMLTLIVPFAVVFMAEALYLFVWEAWLGKMLGAL